MLNFIIVFVFNSSFFIDCANVVHLKNAEWKLQNGEHDLTKAKELSVNIPSGVYTDLVLSKQLPQDIFYRFNDIKYRWVGNKFWYYTTQFSVDETILKASYIELICHGISGYSTLYLNNNIDEIIGKTINAFVRYRFDVSKSLKKDNSLTIVLKPTLDIARILARVRNLLVFPNFISKWNGEKYVNQMRTMQASFGSDFGPVFPSVGIWKDIDLVAYDNDEVIIRDIMVSTFLEDKEWNVKLEIHNDTPLNYPNKITGTFEVTFFLENNIRIPFSKNIFMEPNELDIIILQVSIPKDDVKQWWPNGYGKQYLYDLTVGFISNNIIRNTKSIKIGFRTVALVQELIDPAKPEKGKSFYFKVNDVPIFAKGANILPTHILLEKASDEKTLKNLVYSAKLANMNMLRVHAAGIYQSDYFYQLCDEYGIMVWQDMMFYLFLYSTTEEFLSTVTTEIEQQITRLQYHPSIILWVGNCETELAIKNKWYIKRNKTGMHLENFKTLFVEKIRDIITQLDSSRPYLPSTPSNAQEFSNNDNPNEFFQGDVNLFRSIDFDPWLTDYYPVVRFVSEYGVQSFPSLETLKKVAVDKDLASINTAFMKHRQHTNDKNDNKEIEHFIRYHFGKVKHTDMENIIYTSQIEQAWSVKLQTEWFRRWKSTITDEGTGKTMGTLFWHLNDVWEAPSFSSIEYGGKWKMLQYYAKKFFAPLLVCVHMDSTGEIRINLISDLLQDTKGNLKMEIFKWDSMDPVSSQISDVTLEREKSNIFMTSTVDEIFSNSQCVSPKSKREKCFLKLTLLDDDNEVVISENYLFPLSFKNIIGLQNPAISTSIINYCENKACLIKIRTNAITLFVWLEMREIAGYFSDNGFIMTELEKEIIFYPENEINVSNIQDFEKLLHVKAITENRLKEFSSFHNNDNSWINKLKWLKRS